MIIFLLLRFYINLFFSSANEVHVLEIYMPIMSK